MTQAADRVWFRLLRLESRIRTAMAQRLKEVGLSAPQCDVLTTLTEREGLTQQDLAERLYVTKGNISSLIDRLVAAGLVERRAIAGDRRSRSIFLTDRGRQLAQGGIAAQRDFVAKTFGRLSGDDLDTFDSLLIAARDLVRAEAQAGSAAGVASIDPQANRKNPASL